MNTKTKRIVGATIVLLIVMAAIVVYPMIGQDKGDKEISITLKQKGKVIYEEKVDTDAGLLSDLLKEMKEDKEIKLEYTNSTYGMFITGMGVNKLVKNEDASSTYWTFSSENNKQCKAANFCDAADSLKIEDKDAFVFTYESFSE